MNLTDFLISIAVGVFISMQLYAYKRINKQVEYFNQFEQIKSSYMTTLNELNEMIKLMEDRERKEIHIRALLREQQQQINTLKEEVKRIKKNN